MRQQNAHKTQSVNKTNCDFGEVVLEVEIFVVGRYDDSHHDPHYHQDLVHLATSVVFFGLCRGWGDCEESSRFQENI
jgi:hypothetical protein